MIITSQDKLKCAQRELRFRRHVYPRLVLEKKMSSSLCSREIELMEAIVTDYHYSAAIETRAEQPELDLSTDGESQKTHLDLNNPAHFSGSGKSDTHL